MRLTVLICAGAALTAGVFVGNAPESQRDAHPESAFTVDQREFLERIRSTPAEIRHGGMFCFAPGTSREYIEAVERAMYGDVDGGVAYELASRWPGSQGDAIFLTYSFVPDGVFQPGVGGQFAGTNEIFDVFNGIFGSTEVWQEFFAEGFEDWHQVAGLSYEMVDDDGAPLFGSPGSETRGDVRISASFMDGNGGVLAFNNFPLAEFGSAGGGDMVLDSGDTATWGNSSQNHLLLRNTIRHEHGHGMGLMHVCPDNGTKLMEPIISTAFDGPQHDDVRSANRHYGDVFSGNDSAGAAADLGPVQAGLTVLHDLSLDDDSDVDYLALTAGPGATLTIQLVPQGFVYETGAQGFLGCFLASTDDVNSLTVHDLALELLDADGQTVLASADGNPAGQAEVISDFALPGAGTYFLRVSTASSTNDVQIYDIGFNAVIESGDGDFDFDGDVDLADAAEFLVCFGSGGSGCEPGDLTGDAVTDLDDWVGFVGVMTGP